MPTTMCPSSILDAIDLRAELGRLEDEAAATGWAWDEPLSRQIDRLLLALKADRR